MRGSGAENLPKLTGSIGSGKNLVEPPELSGHDFSRAENASNFDRALAPVKSTVGPATRVGPKALLVLL